MADLDTVLARLAQATDHETSPGSGIAAGQVEGLSLAPMASLMTLLGDPQHAAPVIHVTGTNGKGTVAAMITRLLMASGLVVGTYSSPHLADLAERLTRDGVPIDAEELAEVLGGVLDVAELAPRAPTWFELVTAAAFRWFAEAPVDVMVVEVGLLGRFDATNVVAADVAVVTNIGADHTDLRPGWEQAVAAEKAGIIEPDSEVVLGDMTDELRAVFEAEGGARVTAIGEDRSRPGRWTVVEEDRIALGGHVVSFETPWARHGGVYVPLHGAAQAHNAALATTAVEAFFDRPVSDEVTEVGMAAVTAPGRIEVLAHQPLVILDGAHNREAAAHLVRTLVREFQPLGSRWLVVGVLAGRDVDEFVAPLVSYGWDAVVAVEPPSPRALPAAELAAGFRRAGVDAEVGSGAGETVAQLLRRLGDEDLVVVAGSFYLAAPVRRALGPG